MTPRSGARARGETPAGPLRRSVVDYALQRRARLADLYAGRASYDEVCDAHPYLLRAARFHGRKLDGACPVCRKDLLAEVHYVYGDALKTIAGQAKTTAELAELAARVPEFAVYVVEVCTGCSWNHLTSSYVLGTGGRRGSPHGGGPAGRAAARATARPTRHRAAPE